MDVKILYQEYLKQGMTPKDAAKQAQAKTGLSVVNGRPINRQIRETKEMIYRGQYGLHK